MESKIAILIGSHFTTVNEGIRPPLPVFFQYFFASLHTSHPIRVILSDDGSDPHFIPVLTEIQQNYPIELYRRETRIGEAANLRWMTEKLQTESYVCYIANDMFIRNKENKDWLDIEINILNIYKPYVASIITGFPFSSTEAWAFREQFDNDYRSMDAISTQHFMMTTDKFRQIDWTYILEGHKWYEWESCFNTQAPAKPSRERHIVYHNHNLGAVSIGHFTREKLASVIVGNESLKANI